MPPIAQIHLVCGATGAGKSTYARRLASDIDGVYFSIDEWMQRLHNADKPATQLYEWFYERVQRNCAQMRDLAEQLVAIGVPSIFDTGLTNRLERKKFTDWAENMGYSIELHFCDVPRPRRWQRVLQRNAEKPATYQFEVTRDMFDFIESMWEAPSEQEMVRYSGKRITD